MRIAAIVCNLLVLGSTAMTVVTEGLPSHMGYLVLTLSVLLVSLLSSVALVWSRTGSRVGKSGGKVLGTFVAAAIMLCNVLVCAACLWAAVSRYPYSEGNGIIPFAVLLVATPVVTVVALLGQHAATGDPMSTTAGAE